MIIDTIDQLGRYVAIRKSFQLVADHVAILDLNAIKPGRYSIDGTDDFYYCFEYETRDVSVCMGEIHTQRIDIHFIIEGCEMIGVSPRAAAELTPYDAENDYSMAVASFQHHTLPAGSAAIFFPHEAHITGITANGEVSKIKKLVFKIFAG
jgi:YhcH/YjgK/YiaL family protein